MLTVSRWAEAIAQLVQSQIGAHATGKGEYVFEIPAIYSSWPCQKSPLQQVAGLYEPLYTGLQEDVDHITELLAGLEGEFEDHEPEEEDEEDVDPCEDFSDPLDWDFDPMTVSLVHRSTDPSIPSIIVTPCPAQNTDTDLCRVPIQDRAFGQRLAVPFHPTFNNAHPPQRLSAGSMLAPSEARLSECWRWNAGHWEVVVPSLWEQRRRGLYSWPSIRKGARSSGPSSPRRFSRTV